MPTRFDLLTTDELIEQLRQQKTSHEMTDDELDGADWIDGFDAMVEATRALLENLSLYQKGPKK